MLNRASTKRVRALECLQQLNNALQTECEANVFLEPSWHRLFSCSIRHTKFFWQFLIGVYSLSNKPNANTIVSAHNFIDFNHCLRRWNRKKPTQTLIISGALQVFKRLFTLLENTRTRQRILTIGIFQQLIAVIQSYFFNLTTNFTLMISVIGTRKKHISFQPLKKSIATSTKTCNRTVIVDTSSYTTQHSIPSLSL